MTNEEEKNLEPIDLALRKVWQKILKMYNQTAMSYNMSFSHGMVLLSIDKEGTPSTQLGPRMGLEPTSLSRTLNSMEELGMITRTPDKKDKRVVFVKLTDKGVEYRRMARDEVRKYNEKLYQSIDNGELEVFMKVLNQIYDLTEY